MTFTPSLLGYCPVMNDYASKLLAVLEQAAASGEVVDLSKELGKMTLAVVGGSAFG